VVDIVQAAGRAMRICDGKQLGYIFLPILLPDGVEFEEYSASSEYKHVLRVIAALANQDERIVEQFQIQLLETDKPEKDKTKVVDFLDYQFAVDPEQLRQQIEISISNFVGRKNYRSFEEAREYIKTLNFNSYKEFRNWSQSANKPTDIPSAPDQKYRFKGWVSWSDFLGHNYIATSKRKSKDFLSARAYIRSLKFKSNKLYKAWCKTSDRPQNIPVNPNITYKGNGWISWSDWLGNNAKNFKRNFRSYSEAKVYIQSKRFIKLSDFKRWAKSLDRPKDIPSNPNAIYKGRGWVDWQDFLGTSRKLGKNRKFLSFNDAKSFVQQLRITSRTMYREWAKSVERPEDIPADPAIIYRNDGWVDWNDWLGTDKKYNRQNRTMMSFEEARNFVRTLNLMSQKEFYSWAKTSKRPLNIPYSPDRTYKDKGWVDWFDWLGKTSTG